MEVTREGGDAVVKLAPQLADLSCIFGQFFLLPPIGDRAQQGDKCGGAGDDHLLIDPELQQVGVLLKGGAVDGFAGQNITTNSGVASNWFQ